MAYTIIRTNGTTLTTIPDGTINTSYSTLSLPGRNYAGYGQAIDTNYIHQLENFAYTSPPAGALMGQLWYNTNDNTLRVCPADGTTNPALWTALASTSGTSTFGNVVASNMDVTGTANIGTADITSLTTAVISAGSSSTNGVITGTWTLAAGSTMQAGYADLAERHHADGEYPCGTVVKVGGVNEITLAAEDDYYDVLGVISTHYAYLMNSTAGPDATHPAVALVGRVPVRVTGPITKGDRVTVAGNGCAMSTQSNYSFGWALETNPLFTEKLVLCVVK
jgi:hypothetical protein